MGETYYQLSRLSSLTRIPEAQRIWERELLWMNISYPQSHGKEVKQSIQDAGAKIISFLDNDESIKMMQWLQMTKEGDEYINKVRTAIMEGR